MSKLNGQKIFVGKTGQLWVKTAPREFTRVFSFEESVEQSKQAEKRGYGKGYKAGRKHLGKVYAKVMEDLNTKVSKWQER